MFGTILVQGNLVSLMADDKTHFPQKSVLFFALFANLPPFPLRFCIKRFRRGKRKGTDEILIRLHLSPAQVGGWMRNRSEREDGPRTSKVRSLYVERGFESLTVASFPVARKNRKMFRNRGPAVASLSVNPF